MAVELVTNSIGVCRDIGHGSRRIISGCAACPHDACVGQSLTRRLVAVASPSEASADAPLARTPRALHAGGWIDNIEHAALVPLTILGLQLHHRLAQAGFSCTQRVRVDPTQ
eukprot:CAMPEP_0119431144 /NCGR_PEP_ID=MMETSP1335-20130426/45376_1 /TAXON_ID=259385 /ORGANISM="Chrysoculter rhomboideus, Strain RCC1486" /LENGTH=111 /DNA_ID=CAMNT_0007456931 /DNA_START=182 /DNA_END=517 /DNA_ORIENTATION=-